MKNLLIIKYDSISIAIISIIHGCNLIVFPDLVDYGQTYEVLSTILNSFTFGAIFIVLGALKLVGVFGNNPRLRAFSLSCLISVWTLFLFCIWFSGIVNSVWILSLAMIIFSFGIIIKGWFH